MLFTAIDLVQPQNILCRPRFAIDTSLPIMMHKSVGVHRGVRTAAQRDRRGKLTAKRIGLQFGPSTKEGPSRGP